jgi:hypothetical protein
MAPKAYTSFFTDIIACRMYSGAMYPLNMLKKGNTSAKENAGKKKGKTHKHAMYSGQWKKSVWKNDILLCSYDAVLDDLVILQHYR